MNFTIERDVFVAAIEAGLANSGNSEFPDEQAKLNEQEREAVREVGRTAESHSLRSFCDCPLSKIIVLEEYGSIDWGFVDGFDDYIDNALGLERDSEDYPHNSVVTIED